jgi:S-DNA-T family DNA segregation ATPase FtsK/SpoIIIE
MDKRYKLMSILGVRSLEGYNEKISSLSSIPDDVRQQLEEENQAEIKELPYIVVVIDELADLMMVTGKKVEQLIARLAQKARASGIHLAIATQRPSVDVITGLIKANIPSRMSFLVSSKVDSRTILDQGGAEQLLGKGDMLFIEPGTSIPKRIHGAFVSDGEVQRVAKKMRELGQPTYIEEVIKSPELIENLEDSDGDDELYNQAVEFVVETRRASISSVQRKFRIGYNRAARLIETMEENGIVSPMNSNGSREVL